MADDIFDPTRKFVRVIEIKKNGMVEFEFSVGEPEMLVELLLPASAFNEFCAENHVITLDQAGPLADVERENELAAPLAWSLHSARTKAVGNT
jgi:phenol hydroxylase P0 protein